RSRVSGKRTTVLHGVAGDKRRAHPARADGCDAGGRQLCPWRPCAPALRGGAHKPARWCRRRSPSTARGSCASGRRSTLLAGRAAHDVAATLDSLDDTAESPERCGAGEVVIGMNRRMLLQGLTAAPLALLARQTPAAER